MEHQQLTRIAHPSHGHQISMLNLNPPATPNHHQHELVQTRNACQMVGGG